MAGDNNDLDLWSRAVAVLDGDERVQPSLMGFVNLAEVKGIIENTLYLEVPNDLARNMFEQRLRDFINEAISGLENNEPRFTAFRLDSALSPTDTLPQPTESSCRSH